MLFSLSFVLCGGQEEAQTEGDAALTDSIDSAIAGGDTSLAWEHFLALSKNSARLLNVSNKLILLDKGIEICLIGNNPGLANEISLKAESLGMLSNPEWRIRGLLRKSEIYFASGKYDAMTAVLDETTGLLNEETSESELSALFAQRAIYAWLTHQETAANQFIEAVLFDSEEDGGSRSRAIVQIILALLIDDQEGEASLVDLNLSLSRRSFERDSAAVAFYTFLAKILQFHEGPSLRSVDDVTLKYASMGDRFSCYWAASTALSAQAELLRRNGELAQAVDVLQKRQVLVMLAAEDHQKWASHWQRVASNFGQLDSKGFQPVSMYLVILTLLMVLLMLVLVLRIQTQRVINKRLVESVEQSRISEQAAEHASKLKSQFVSNVSHEIKTPMSGLVGMTSLLEELIVDPVQRKYLATIRTCSRNLLVMLNDLLDLGRIEANKMDIESVPFLVDETINYCSEVVRLNALEKGLNLAVDISPEIPKTLIGDSTRLSQIIVNLLHNAIKFTEEGHVKMSVEIERPIGNSQRLIVKVADTGRGIEPDRLQTVFEPFNQEPTQEKNEGTGSGLGLAICKSLTDHMGGSLDVQSEFGKGSIFTLSLPVGLSTF